MPFPVAPKQVPQPSFLRDLVFPESDQHGTLRWKQSSGHSSCCRGPRPGEGDQRPHVRLCSTLGGPPRCLWATPGLMLVPRGVWEHPLLGWSLSLTPAGMQGTTCWQSGQLFLRVSGPQSWSHVLGTFCAFCLGTGEDVSPNPDPPQPTPPNRLSSKEPGLVPTACSPAAPAPRAALPSLGLGSEALRCPILLSLAPSSP